MPKICYQDKNFRADKLELIDKINSIVDEYTEQGYSLTYARHIISWLQEVLFQTMREVIKTLETSSMMPVLLVSLTGTLLLTGQET